jgi:FKBP-type peptidyl-prolyl cis-trans isomerase
LLQVGINFEGRIQESNDVFDKQGEGGLYNFRLGSEEYLGDWNEGIKGMQVGGKRRITIPAHALSTVLASRMINESESVFLADSGLLLEQDICHDFEK